MCSDCADKLPGVMTVLELSGPVLLLVLRLLDIVGDKKMGKTAEHEHVF